MKHLKSISVLSIGMLLFLSCKKEKPISESNEKVQSESQISYPSTNPFLAQGIYGVTHVNSGQTNCVPYSLNDGEYKADLNQLTPIWGGPVNNVTYASANKNFMWSVSTDRIALIDKSGNNWNLVTDIDLPGAKRLTIDQLKSIADVKYTSLDFATKHLKGILGPEPGLVLPAGVYALVSSDDYVYANAGTVVSAVGLKDKNDPKKGLEVKYRFDVSKIIPASEVAPGIKRINMVGMNMTYDGHIVIGAVNGVAVIDRELKGPGKFYSFKDTELCTNSMAVDEKNGIYVATGSKTPKGDGMMRKLVWTGNEISDKESDGAWISPYNGGDWPPAIKAGTGAGSTPTLMGFGEDEDKLVLITDGQNRMNLVAFWRDAIPESHQQKQGAKSRRIAGFIPIKAGLPEDKPWIQSEQTIVVNGWGAFLVNNLIDEGHPDRIIDVMTVGPLHPGPKGMERVEWNPTTNEFSSVWTRNDVVSTSMVPLVTSGSNMVLVNGYTAEKGWEITGLDWNTGKNRTRVEFGQTNRGNGAYAILQLLENGDLLFNSVIGPYRIPLKK
ncbi:MAG: hypothetical protein ACOVQR_02030 [Flavobacterium sp.]|uniref:hypothetical protein n=1 Tax=Flavobacterium sp. TaxID=239 RepID=UPI003BA3EC4C